MMQTGYYNWRATLADGTVLDEWKDGAHNSLFRPRREVRRIELIGSLPTLAMDIPEGAGVICFRETRGGALGFDANRAYPGLFYLLTSNSEKKRVAERIANGEDAQSAALAECGGDIGERMARQVASGYTRDMHELLTFHVYAIGWHKDGVKVVQWIAPNGATTTTNGDDVEIIEDGTATLKSPSVLGNDYYRLLADFHKERILDRMRLCEEEFQSLRATVESW